MSDDPKRLFVAIVRDELGACDERIWVLDQESLQGAWTENQLFLKAWTVKAFVSDPKIRIRLEETLKQVQWFFIELGRKEKTPYRKDLVEDLCQRILTAWFPTVEEVVESGTEGPELKAKLLMRRFIGDRWLAKSS